MNNTIKKSIKSGLISGLAFSCLMTGNDYLGGQEFNIYQFLFNTFFFGIAMGLITRYNLRKQKIHK
ncbi:hypothetical protein [Snuella sedimenti]|uniref:Lipoprotein n=1 Tax=Snuella sedimenti TaxID=2798802 RepID=A0A8J7ISE7_9FLAO|nr:hypothetical protein [Snuella sedimenti]MBJ6367040.1 hypothetical protein [Snuella sedimenti]